MKLSQLKTGLALHPEKPVRFVLPTGTAIPPHAHVTEVARISKHFVDCGGVRREDFFCRMQTWHADDTAHRLTSGKLLSILEKAAPLFGELDPEVDIEHEAPFLSVFPVEATTESEAAFVIRLGIRHADCLAQDRCGVPSTNFQALTFKPISRKP